MRERISVHPIMTNLVLGAVVGTLLMFFWLILSKSYSGYGSLVVLIVGGAFLFWVLWHLVQVKDVCVAGDQLYISHWGKKVAIPLSSVDFVEERYRFLRGMRLVEIELHRKTIFGDRIPFALRTFKWDTVNDEVALGVLRNAVAAAKLIKDKQRQIQKG